VILIAVSAACGGACALVLRGWLGLVCSAALPWLGVLAWLLYNEYFVPYRGGGASMWPIALFFAGWGAALAGLAGYGLAYWVRRRREQSAF
jgi:hypothetical protein